MDAGGGQIRTGPFAAKALAGKQILKDAFGIDLGGIPESEVASKTGFALATEASRAISSRGGTQAEFLKALTNVPGLFLSQAGNKAMVSILQQEAQNEQQLGVMAYDHKPGENWISKQQQFYQAHPIIPPFTNKPMGQADVDYLRSQADPTGTSMPGDVAAPQRDAAAPAPAVPWTYGKRRP